MLLARRGEGMLADGLAALARAESTGQGRSARQAQLSYIEARLCTAIANTTRRPRVSRRRAALQPAGVLMPCSHALPAICVYQGSVKATGSAFLELAGEVDEGRYPSLAGRALWMAGTPQMVQGRMESAITFFERMRALLDRGEGPAQAAIADINLAATFETRGEIEKAWSYLLAGIRAAASHTSSHRRYNPLFQAAIAAHSQKDPQLAELYLDEAWAEPTTRSNATFRAEIWAERSRLSRERGDLCRSGPHLAGGAGRGRVDRRPRRKKPDGRHRRPDQRGALAGKRSGGCDPVSPSASPNGSQRMAGKCRRAK